VNDEGYPFSPLRFGMMLLDKAVKGKREEAVPEPPLSIGAWRFVRIPL
jgi:hypothetical protein